MNRSVAAWVTVALLGCWASPMDRHLEGRLEEGDPPHPHDGSFYDETTFKARSGWPITVTMESDEVDAYLVLFREGDLERPLAERWFLQNDNADGTNAQIVTEAPEDDTYVVWATSREADETGDYTLRIVTRSAETGD